MRVNRMALFATFCALVLTGCAAKSAGPISESDRTAMHSAVDGFTKAILAGDLATAASKWSEDATALPPNGAEVHGRPEIQKLFAGFGKTTAFTQNVVETDGRGDLAYSHITFGITFTPPGATASATDKGKGILVWGKQADGTWLVKKGAWNSDLPLPK
jgi:ketosteroid isomerase-like protein